MLWTIRSLFSTFAAGQSQNCCHLNEMLRSLKVIRSITPIYWEWHQTFVTFISISLLNYCHKSANSRAKFDVKESQKSHQSLGYIHTIKWIRVSTPFQSPVGGRQPPQHPVPPDTTALMTCRCSFSSQTLLYASLTDTQITHAFTTIIISIIKI